MENEKKFNTEMFGYDKKEVEEYKSQIDLIKKTEYYIRYIEITKN